MIRLLLVGEQPGVLKGLKMRLTAENDMQVVGKASDSETAIKLADFSHPDVVLIDIDMLRSDGITTAKKIRLKYPGVSIILLSFYDDALTCAQAEESGANAFIPKSLPASILLNKIRQFS
jgi:DNA-binding NarL/FixJ family response regulator